MDTRESGGGTLAVPGARLHYEVRGKGPLLILMAGGNSDADVFGSLAAVLATGHRVVSYDPRGNSRSVLDGPPADQRIEVHADDAYRLLDAVAAPGERASAFGSCSGGLTALELMLRHPDRVGSVVVHEPPSLSLLPDAEDQLAFIEEVHTVFRREGVGAAMARFSSLFGGRSAPVLPEAQDNSAFFLAHTMRPFTRFVPDVAGLVPMAARIAVAGGRESRTHVARRPVVVLAERLGRELVEFPGGHSGYAKWPAEFARLLLALFATLPTGQGRAPCGS
ncbi:alpha/beta fold hydrolase [Streptomyces sp. NPDC096310]|uniref:alpha/beta fold hydrolase n=1 Tax=Streptomyces sp. NPDC096310 TaxID=3366082 RepID=UPI0038146A7D